MMMTKTSLNITKGKELLNYGRKELLLTVAFVQRKATALKMKYTNGNGIRRITGMGIRG